MSFGTITASAPAASAGTQAGAQVVRIGYAVEHQQQRRTFGAVEQFVEHRFAPDLARAHVRDYTLVHTFDPGVHFTALSLADLDTILVGQLDQRLYARITATFRPARSA